MTAAVICGRIPDFYDPSTKKPKKRISGNKTLTIKILEENIVLRATLYLFATNLKPFVSVKFWRGQCNFCLFNLFTGYTVCFMLYERNARTENNTKSYSWFSVTKQCKLDKRKAIFFLPLRCNILDKSASSALVYFSTATDLFYISSEFIAAILFVLIIYHKIFYHTVAWFIDSWVVGSSASDFIIYKNQHYNEILPVQFQEIKR